MPAPEIDDRVFIRDGRRVYRRRFSVTEVKAGAVVLVALAALAAWVAWKGRHPEPGLFEGNTELPSAGGPAGAAERGPIPTSLAPEGWDEGAPSTFDAENLYVKVNGRADFYISFGCQRLWVVTLIDRADPSRTIDVELFDMGTTEKALGAYEGERSPDTPSTSSAGTTYHLDRNALFLARGKHYVRLIGSTDDERLHEALGSMRERLEKELPAGELPWSHVLFAGKLGIPAGSIGFEPENAFSFGFARDVHVGRLADGSTELFVVDAKDEGAAADLAGRFVAGFREYGEDGGSAGGAAFAKDRYLGTFASAVAEGRWVAGIRGAPDRDAAMRELRRLRDALATLTADPVPASKEMAPAAPKPGTGSPPPEENQTGTPYN